MKRDNLRPCVVTMPGETEESRYLTGERKVRKITPDVVFNGYFHMWCNESYVVGESIMIGGHSAGQVSHITALVEKEDGAICSVEPEWIRFTDAG